MKKPVISPKITDHICPQVYKAPRRTTQCAKEFYADPSPPKIRPRISYISDVIPPEQVENPPRIFIRGLIGGSIDLDLRGLDIQLSEAAFAHWVADESLKLLHVHRGDIAIIDNKHRILREGNLILLELRGREVLRRLRRRHRIWYLETAAGGKQEPVPLTDQPLHGAVVGILRLFTRVRPLRYHCRSADLSLPGEMQSCDLRIPSKTREPEGKSRQSTIHHRSPAKQSAVALAAEDAAPYCPSPNRKKRRSLGANKHFL